MIMCFLKEYSEALMVIITFVYVVATFLIFWVKLKISESIRRTINGNKAAI